MKYAMVDIIKTKNNLQSILEKQLIILRELLSNIHQEQEYLNCKNFGAIQEVISSRLLLLNSFGEWNLRFFQEIKKFSILIKEQKKIESIFSIEILEWLKTHLKASDIELILLCEQLLQILMKIQERNATILNSLEEKSSSFTFFHALQPMPLPAPLHTAVTVLDLEKDQE